MLTATTSSLLNKSTYYELRNITFIIIDIIWTYIMYEQLSYLINILKKKFKYKRLWMLRFIYKRVNNIKNYK